ncbi:MAG: bifunctional nuclease family protein [Candidatus Marinimicrobia bacterium]|nr:bifunctional nuclease family protein [Candidatus Neomarinimicrobiota bacterium]
MKTKDKLIPVKIKKIIFFPPSKNYAIILNDAETNMQLPIIIGTYEAQAIALGIENIKMPRPMTHDLLSNIMEQENLKVQKIVINKLLEGTFYAAIYYTRSNHEVVKIDSRPSDAIAVALRTDSEIFVSEEVMMEAGQHINLDEVSEIKEDLKSPANNIDILDQIHECNLKLQDAIDMENYELAAQFRDKIQFLESKIHN